jgi:hypothetical protein
LHSCYDASVRSKEREMRMRADNLPGLLKVSHQPHTPYMYSHGLFPLSLSLSVFLSTLTHTIPKSR